jgi:hypothetical protein
MQFLSGIAWMVLSMSQIICSFPRFLGGMFSAKTSLSLSFFQPCAIAEDNIMHSSLSASHPAQLPNSICDRLLWVLKMLHKADGHMRGR